MHVVQEWEYTATAWSPGVAAAPQQIPDDPVLTAVHVLVAVKLKLLAGNLKLGENNKPKTHLV